jgi:YD repeat-containing protein
MVVLITGLADQAKASEIASPNVPGMPGVIGEVPELRTENSDTFTTAAGGDLARISDQPINYRVNGRWVPIDDDLTEAAGGVLHPRSSSAPISLPALAGGDVVLGEGPTRMAISLEGAAPAKGHAFGSSQTYQNALPEADIAWEARSGSLRQTIKFATRHRSLAYRYRLSLAPGLSAAMSGDGGLRVSNASGATVYTFPAPDVTVSHGAQVEAATAHYVLSSDGTTLTLLVSRAAPVVSPMTVMGEVDGEIYFKGEPGEDCTISNGSNEKISLCSGKLQLGTDAQGRTYRTLLHFNMTAVTESSVVIASTLDLPGCNFSSGTTKPSVGGYALTEPFTGQATWVTRNGSAPWATPGGTFASTPLGEAKFEELGPKENTYKLSLAIPFVPEVEQWIQAPSSNDGVLLEPSGKSSGSLVSCVQFGDYGQPEPFMLVYYEPHLGAAPGQPTLEQSLGDGGALGVNLSNGNLHVTYPDVKYATEGYDTELARTYNSKEGYLLAHENAFGGNWHLSLGEDMKLESAFGSVGRFLQQSDGSYVRFDPAPWADGKPEAGDEAFTTEPNTPATLIVKGATATLTYNNTGVVWKFAQWGDPTEISDPGGEGNKLTLTYSEENRMTRLADTHGHTLTVAREKEFSIRHEHEKPITQIKSATGEVWTYGYKATSGELESVKGPNGHSVTYGYNAEKLLSSITDEGGTTVISYDGKGRVASLRKVVNGTVERVGSEDEITAINYGTEETTVKSPTGTEAVYEYNALGYTTEERSVSEAASEFYSGYAGISISVASQDLLVQNQESELDSELQGQLGEGYVGSWFEPRDGAVEVGILSSGYEQTVLQDAASLGLATITHVVSEKTGVAALEAGQITIREKLASLIGKGSVATSVQPAADAVVIEEADTLTSAQKKEVSEAANGAKVPSEIQLTSDESVGATTDSQRCMNGTCGRPLRGGTQILLPGSKEVGCTAGFIARSIYNGLPYVMTAGHCLKGNIGKEWEENVNVLKEGEAPGEEGVRFVGPAHSYMFGKNEEIPGGTTIKGDAGLIAIKTNGFWANPLEPLVLVYASAETTRNEQYVISGTRYDPEGPRAGVVVCVGGYGKARGEESEGAPESGRETCGIDQGFANVTYAGGTEVQHVEVLDTCYKGHVGLLGHGTSGSPVYKWHQAYGISSGGQVHGCDLYYNGINQAETALHVHILTSSSK